jgi:hypothetical protein
MERIKSSGAVFLPWFRVRSMNQRHPSTSFSAARVSIAGHTSKSNFAAIIQDRVPENFPTWNGLWICRPFKRRVSLFVFSSLRLVRESGRMQPRQRQCRIARDSRPLLVKDKALKRGLTCFLD